MDDVLNKLRHLANTKMERPLKARQAAELIRESGSYRWVGLYDVTSTEIAAIAWTGTEPPAYPRFAITRGLSGVAVATRQPVIVQDVTHDPRYLTAFGSTRSEAIFPIAAEDGRIVGTIDVESDRVNAFGPEDAAFLGRCAQVLVPVWTELKEDA
jgi:GAF domain-containing protein